MPNLALAQLLPPSLAPLNRLRAILERRLHQDGVGKPSSQRLATARANTTALSPDMALKYALKRRVSNVS